MFILDWDDEYSLLVVRTEAGEAVHEAHHVVISFAGRDFLIDDMENPEVGVKTFPPCKPHCTMKEKTTNKEHWLGQIFPGEFSAVFRVPKCIGAFEISLIKESVWADSQRRRQFGSEKLNTVLSRRFRAFGASPQEGAGVRRDVVYWAFPPEGGDPVRLQDTSQERNNYVVRSYNLRSERPAVAITSFFTAAGGLQSQSRCAVDEGSMKFAVVPGISEHHYDGDLDGGLEIYYGSAIAVDLEIDVTSYWHRIDRVFDRVFFFVHPYDYDKKGESGREGQAFPASHGERLERDGSIYLAFRAVNIVPLDSFGFWTPDQEGFWERNEVRKGEREKTRCLAFTYGGPSNPTLRLSPEIEESFELVFDRKLGPSLKEEADVRPIWEERDPQALRSEVDEWCRAKPSTATLPVRSHVDLVESLDGALSYRKKRFDALWLNFRDYSLFWLVPQWYRAVAYHPTLDVQKLEKGGGALEWECGCPAALTSLVAKGGDVDQLRQWILNVDPYDQYLIWECVIQGVDIEVFHSMGVMIDTIITPDLADEMVVELRWIAEGQGNSAEKMEKLVYQLIALAQEASQLGGLRGSRGSAVKGLEAGIVWPADGRTLSISKDDYKPLTIYFPFWKNNAGGASTLPVPTVKLSVLLTFFEMAREAEAVVQEQFSLARDLLKRHLHIDPPQPKREQEWWHRYGVRGAIIDGDESKNGANNIDYRDLWGKDKAALEAELLKKCAEIGLDAFYSQIRAHIRVPAVIFYVLSVVRTFSESVDKIRGIYGFTEILLQGGDVTSEIVSFPDVSKNLMEFIDARRRITKTIGALSRQNYSIFIWDDVCPEEYRRFHEGLENNIRTLQRSLQSGVGSMANNPYAPVTFTPALDLCEQLLSLIPWFASRQIWTHWLKELDALAECDAGWGEAQQLRADVSLRLSARMSAWPGMVARIIALKNRSALPGGAAPASTSGAVKVGRKKKAVEKLSSTEGGGK